MLYSPIINECAACDRSSLFSPFNPSINILDSSSSHDPQAPPPPRGVYSDPELCAASSRRALAFRNRCLLGVIFIQLPDDPPHSLQVHGHWHSIFQFNFYELYALTKHRSHRKT